MDYPSNMKLRLLAAVVRGDIKTVLESELPSSEEISSCLQRIDPYVKARQDDAGNRIVPAFSASNPVLSSIDDCITSRLNWSAQVFAEEVLAGILARGESQETKCRKPFACNQGHTTMVRNVACVSNKGVS